MRVARLTLGSCFFMRRRGWFFHWYLRLFLMIYFFFLRLDYILFFLFWLLFLLFLLLYNCLFLLDFCSFFLFGRRRCLFLYLFLFFLQDFNFALEMALCHFLGCKLGLTYCFFLDTDAIGGCLVFADRLSVIPVCFFVGFEWVSLFGLGLIWAVEMGSIFLLL